MPTVTESLRLFLSKRGDQHNADIVARYLQHFGAMETQINVAAGDGFPVEGRRNTYSNGIDEWFNIRIPKNANSEPSFNDYEIHWPLDLHAEAIGCTGWDWRHRASLWVGFDFDSITGHAAGVGVSDADLDKVRTAAQALPYVEVRKSTGGGGLHLYVHLDAIPTQNHTEHAALGRAVLGMMGSETGFDFGAQIDACGGNMWIWHRKMSAENEGLKLLKASTQVLTEADLPVNWKAHIDVIARKRTKVRVEGVEDAHYDPFEVLASSRRIVPLDPRHKEIIEELQRSGYSCIWIDDHKLLQTHTCAFQQLMEEKAEELELTGFFKTNSRGADKGTPNCFAFPLENGAFKVYKFSPGNVEDVTWEQDGEGWTTCYFNKSPNLKVAARALGGIEDAEKGGFVFETFEAAAQAAKALGQDVKIPENLATRETTLVAHKDGRLVIKVAKVEGDEGMKNLGWLAKRNQWTQVFETKASNKVDEISIAEFDHIVRALITPDSKRAGWVVKQEDRDEWVWQPKDDARSALLSMQYTKPDAEVILGRATRKGWRLVNMPFQPEFPGDRQWNYGAAQFRYKPVELMDDETPQHPHWDMILKHCGQDLDEAIRGLDWAKDANIRSGMDYLLCWAACMFQQPYEKLPYLFFYGDQNSGKSIFHESLALLMSGGVAAADRALMSDYNGELANAVMAIVEERDISLSPGSYNRLKEWVTGYTIWIRKMRTDAYPQVNTLHFIQTANDREAVVIKPGDTRIVVIYVPMLQPGQEIPKPVLIQRLIEEAPHFMRTLMDFTLPPMMGRLRLPPVMTSTKERAEELSRNPLEAFIGECCFDAPGETVSFQEFHTAFCEWLDTEKPPEYGSWQNKNKVARNLPHRFPFGAGTGNKRFIGNISFEQPTDTSAKPLVVKAGRLKPQA